MSSTKKSARTPPSPVVGTSKPRLLDALGPGLITGASDDDPSGIATYSQAGAQFGYTLSWTMLLTYPLMAAACHGVFYFFLRAAARASAMACLNPAASSTPGTRNVPTMKAGVP